MVENQIFKHFYRIFPIIILCSVFLVGQTRAAVTVDSTSSGGAFDNAGITTFSFPHTVNNTCTDCVLYVAVSTFTQINVLTARVLNVSYGAQTLTPVGTQVSPIPQLPTVGNTSVEMFRLVNPPIGMATVTVNFAVPVNYAVGGANSLKGVNLMNPNGAFFSSSGDSANPAVTASGAVAGDLVLDALGTTPNGGFVAPDATQTNLYNGRAFFGLAFDVGAGSTESPLAANVPMTWTIGNSAVWALGAIVVRQSLTTAATAPISGRIRTEKGGVINETIVILQNLTTGEQRRVLTNKRGVYRFEELEVGRLYQIRVLNKNYNFPVSSHLVNLTEAVEDLDFIGN